MKMERKKYMKWLVLLVGVLCSVGVKATDVNSVSSLISALNSKAKDIGNNTVQLTDNIDLSQTINVTGGDLTLDLGGYSIYNKWSGMGSSNKKKIDIFDIEDGTFTIQGDGSVYNQGTEGNSTIWVKGGTLNVSSTVYSKKQTAIYISKGIVNVKTGASIYTESDGGKYQPVKAMGGELNISGGNIYRAMLTDKKAVGLYIENAKVIMSGGTVRGESKGNDEAIGVEIASGEFSMSDGNISAKNQNVTAFDGNNARGLNIKGGVVKLKQGTISGNSSNRTSYAISSNQPFSSICVTGYGIYKDNLLQPMTNVEVQGGIEIKPISYIIKYSGVDPEREEIYDITKGSISLSEEIKRGYDFNGWSDKVGKVTSISYTNVSNRSDNYIYTLTAQWALHNYTIKYYSEGNEITSVGTNPQTYQIGNTTTLQSISKDGAVFIGWKDRSTGQMITNLPGNDPRDLKLDAIWDKKYNITFVTGTSESISGISTTTSQEVLIPIPNEKKGYIFEYWSDKKGNTIHDKISANVYDSDITLTAVWSPITYHVAFKDGEETKDTKEYTIESGLSGFPTIRKDGYVFNSWLNDNQMPVSSISEGTIGDKTFTADWTEITYTLTYDYADGETSSSSDTYKYTEVSQTQLRSASREGYNFLGWFLPGSTDKLEKVPTPISDTQKEFLFTATAKWEIQNYKVIFYLNDGTGAVLSEKEYTYNVNTGIPEEDMPKDVKRTGYDFGGWFGNEACTGDKIDNVSAGAGELKLYAKWTPKTYTITYDMQGGTNASNAPSSFIYNEGCLLPSENVKRDHYVFAGWTTEATSTTYVKSIPANTEGNKKIYAQWTPCVYTISYVTNTETTLPAQSYLYGTEVKTKKTYKEGYTLTWCYDATLTRPFGDLITAEKIPAGIGDELALYAKWTPTEYMITYDSYYGKITSGKVDKYTIEQEVILPADVHREGFTFAGWYADDLLKEKVTKIEKGSSGNKTFYATWDRGYQVIFTQPANGKITVSWNGSAVSPGTMIGKGESLTVSAEATNVNYELKQILINGKPFTSSPQLVTMPKEDLKITAEFTEASTPAAPAPEIIITPSGVDKFPKGEDVKVQLKKTDESTTLYYNLAGVERKYEKEFVVASAQDTVLLKAIARKQGLRDGVISRYIIFDNGKITLTFNLPLGVKAVNPSGGEVVTATTTGGSFEFELKVDREYYTNLDSMVVSANDSVIKAGSAGLYTLTNCTSDVTVTVSGLKAKVCNVTLQQTDNGTISFTDGAEETTMEVEYGTSVSVTAKADEDFKFLQWSTGSQSNPLKLTVDKDTTISARFINDYKAYAITLPQLEGVTVRPFTGYSTEVKKDGTFKFYLKLADGYREENPVVRANGEVLAKNKGGYAIYKVNKNISISVEGIVREPVTLKVPGNVNAKVVETMSNASKQEVYEETMILLHAEAPTGKIFDKWTDSKTDNPRMVPAVDAEQLHPLFTNKGDANYAKVILNQSPGAGITAVNANIDGVKTGETVQLNVVLLPAYSQSEVTLTVDGEVLKPSVSLRAASETKTYMYSLPVKKDEITVKVSGMKLNTYNVSLAQTDGGVVYSNPAGTATHGDKIQLKAQPEPGMLFVKWWDGNTLNPYPYTVTADTEVKASFLGAESTVDNESIRKDDPIEITTDGNRLSIKVDKEYQVYIYNFGGGLYQKRKIPAGGYSMYLPSGEYLIKVGDDIVRKVIIL